MYTVGSGFSYHHLYLSWSTSSSPVFFNWWSGLSSLKADVNLLQHYTHQTHKHMLKTVDPRQESTSLMGWAKQATCTVYNFGMDKKCSEFYTLNAHPVRFVTATYSSPHSTLVNVVHSGLEVINAGGEKDYF